MKYIEQKELYYSPEGQRLLNDSSIPPHASTSSKCHRAKPIIDSLKSTRMPESVLEPVLHARSVAMNGFVKEMLAESLTNKSAVQRNRDTSCAIQKSENASCSSISTCTSGSKLSPASIKSESSPTPCSVTQISSTSSPSCLSTVPLNTPVSDSDSDTQQLVPASQMVCATEQSTRSYFSPQLKVQQGYTSHVSNLPNSVEQGEVLSPLMSGSSIDSSPVSSTMTSTMQQDFIPSPEQFLNSVSDCGAMLETCSPYNSAISADFSPSSAYPTEMDPMLHTASSTNSIPSTDSVPFQNPNFILQAPLNDFNVEIPSSFDFSDTTTSPFSAQSSPFSNSAVSMPTAQTFDSSNILISSNNSLMQQVVGEVSLDESSLDSLAAALPDPATSMDPMLSYSSPSTSLISNSNSPASLQDSMFCSPSHLNAEFTSQVLVDSDMSDVYNLSALVSNPEVQDILQQFM